MSICFILNSCNLQLNKNCPCDYKCVLAALKTRNFSLFIISIYKTIQVSVDSLNDKVAEKEEEVVVAVSYIFIILCCKSKVTELILSDRV